MSGGQRPRRFFGIDHDLDDAAGRPKFGDPALERAPRVRPAIRNVERGGEPIEVVRVSRREVLLEHIPVLADGSSWKMPPPPLFRMTRVTGGAAAARAGSDERS